MALGRTGTLQTGQSTSYSGDIAFSSDHTYFERNAAYGNSTAASSEDSSTTEAPVEAIAPAEETSTFQPAEPIIQQQDFNIAALRHMHQRMQRLDAVSDEITLDPRSLLDSDDIADQPLTFHDEKATLPLPLLKLMLAKQEPLEKSMLNQMKLMPKRHGQPVTGLLNMFQMVAHHVSF